MTSTTGARFTAARRVGLLTAALAVAAVVLLLTVVRHLPSPETPLALPWPAWVAAFALAEAVVVHVQLQRDSHSFSMGDLVLVAGLYLLEPAALVPLYVGGAALALVLHRRQRGLKLAFNVAQFALAGCLAAVVFDVVGRGTLLSGAWDWVAALAAVAVATVTAGLCVFAAMRSSGQRLGAAELPRMLALSLPFALGVASVGLLAAHIAVQNAALLGLLVLPSLLLIGAYRAYTRAREQQHNLRLLHEITSLLYDNADAPTALTDFLTAVRGAFRAQAAELVLLGEGDAGATLSRSSDGDAPVALLPVTHPEDAERLLAAAEEAGWLAARTGTAPGAELDRYALGHGLKDAMVAALRTEEKVLGLLLVSDRLGDVGTFAGSDLALLETFARHVATSLDRGRLETDLRRIVELQEELRHQAMHDPLTGLPNRTLFLDRTRHELLLAGRNGQWPAVLYLDLDGFKPVNDTYGHQAGDLLLKIFATRLQECLRSADTPARLGGDEFAVLLHGPIDIEGIELVLARIQEMLDRPIDVGGGRSAIIGSSIGVVAAGPDTDIDELIRRADLAMYTAKRSGGRRHLFYDATLEPDEANAP